MKHLLIISCLILCYCSSEKEDTETSSSLSSSSFLNIMLGSSSSSDLPSSSSAELREASILDCSPEDIAEYPISDTFPTLSNLFETGDSIRIPFETGDIRIGGCGLKLKISKEGLLFGVQGGVRCITTDRFFGLFGGYDSDNRLMLNCTTEEEVKELGSYYVSYWKKLKCPGEHPWLTATIVDERVLHISVNRNETENERKMYIHPSCQANISITQSPNEIPHRK
jgi:hypothetical protein